jgi:4-hydroxybenzoate polyprenyltransferase
MKLNSFFIIIRPHQWLKNFLVFPLFFLNHKSLEILITPNLWLIFICFSIVASGIYCANDVIDKDNDRKHPTKKFRPIASGALRVNQAIFLATVLITLGLSLSLYINTSFFFIICMYLLLNIFYNFIFKKIVYIDVFILTFFYIIRIISTISIPGINLSYWFISFSFFLFLSLAFLKRCIDFDSKEYIDITSSTKLKDLFFTSSIIAFVTSLSVLISFFNSSQFISSYEKTFLIYFLIIPYLYLFLNMLTAVKLNRIRVDPIIFFITDKKSVTALLVSSLIFIFAIL